MASRDEQKKRAIAQECAKTAHNILTGEGGGSFEERKFKAVSLIEKEIKQACRDNPTERHIYEGAFEFFGEELDKLIQETEMEIDQHIQKTMDVGA